MSQRMGSVQPRDPGAPEEGRSDVERMEGDDGWDTQRGRARSERIEEEPEGGEAREADDLEVQRRIRRSEGDH